MNFLVLTTRKPGVKTGLLPKDLYDAFKKNIDYFLEFKKEGKIVSMGSLADQKHASYKLFDVESREEVERIVNNAPLKVLTEDKIYQIDEFDEVLTRLKSRIG